MGVKRHTLHFHQFPYYPVLVCAHYLRHVCHVLWTKAVEEALPGPTLKRTRSRKIFKQDSLVLR